MEKRYGVGVFAFSPEMQEQLMLAEAAWLIYAQDLPQYTAAQQLIDDVRTP